MALICLCSWQVVVTLVMALVLVPVFAVPAGLCGGGGSAGDRVLGMNGFF